MKLLDEFQITPLEFFQQIEELIQRHKFNYVDAIIFWANKNDVNVEDLTSLINKNLKNKLQADYEKLNYLPRTGKLPGV
jgi:hypothetical protein